MSLSNFGQRKKKEAVRRLSVGKATRTRGSQRKITVGSDKIRLSKQGGDEQTKTSIKRNEASSSRSHRGLPDGSYEEGFLTQDISDLETFGEETSPVKRPVKRPKSIEGIFSRAITAVTDSGPNVITRISSRKTTTPSKNAGEFRGDPVGSSTVIRIKGIPYRLNNKDFLHDFYKKFGTVKRVYSTPKNNEAVIHFVDLKSAADAKKNGTVLENGTKPVAIFFSRPRSTESTHPKVSVKPDFTEKRVLVKKKTSSTVPVVKETTVQKESQPGIENLSHFIGKTAKTTNEKVELLENRDKILRQYRKKTTDLKCSKVTIGTCLDMCPEKERYMRQDRRHLSIFEILPGTEHNKHGEVPHVDHIRAIKEYSRSSADQDAALPHELRPGPVLLKTMDYILHFILDNSNDKWAEWYDFIWNRTRGIRKDITQQNLTDKTAVTLVEKCARFHIFCSHRLCEEILGVFDPKINSENLTKCLQSLEHLYVDLKNDNIFCENEAEFRAYDILLNLNEGDILRKVQLYREEVRESIDVKQAVNAFYAVNSNNFVKFFKIVRQTKYLNACILHRYFTQIRTRALAIMNRSYSVPNHPTQYPLQDLLRILAFQDNEEATEFCEEHGLAVSNGCVQFDRSTFIHPEISITAKRSLFIIESKNTSCIGEVVNGGPLSDYELHRPVSSFDSNDRYIGDNTTSKVSDIVSQEKTAIDVKPQPSSPVYIPPVPPVPVMVPPTLDMICSDEVIKNIARELFLDVINESALQISQAYVSSVHLFINVSNIAMETILEEVSYDMTKDMIVDAIRVEELQEEQKRITAAEYERSKNDSIQDIFHEMIDETVHDQCRDLSLRQMRDVKESLKNESIERVGTSLIVDLVDDCVSKECQAISHKTLQEEETLRDLKLSSISDTVQRRIRGRFFKRWCNEYAGRLRLKRSMFTFPSAPLLLTPYQQVEILTPTPIGITNQSVALNKRARLSLESPLSIANDWLEISDRILLHRNKIEVLKEAVWKAMDLPQLILKALDKHKKNDCFWKLVLSLPEDDYGCHDNKLLIEWMEAKLSRGKLKEEVHDKVKTLSLYTSVNNVNHMEKISVSVCTKAIKGDLSVTGSVHVLGTSGIIFTLPKLPEEKNLQLDYWLLCKSRLESLLKNKPWIPSVPVVIVLLDWTSTYNIQYQCVEELHLNELKESGLLSVYSIVNLSSDIMDMDNVQQFSDCLQWLATSRPLVPKLTANTLQDYLECGVVEYFITPLLQDTVNYPCEITQDPNRYASLYNSVLEHLLQRITSDELCNISWPIPEFTAVHTEPDLPTVSWNSDKNHQKFKSVISSCQLPWIPTLPKTDSWNDVFTIVLRYIDNLPKRPGQDKTALYSRVKWLLRRSFEDYKYSDYLDSSFDQSLWKHVPFNLIIESCVAYMIQSVKYADIIWVYYEDKSDRYRPPVLSTVNVAPCADVSDAEEEEDSAVLTQSSNIKICNPKLEQTIQNVNDLEQLMIQEKRHSDSYDSQLQKWLNEPHTDVRFQELLPSGRRESYQSLSEKIEELEEKVNMSRRAERLSEITLNSWLQY